MNHMRLVCLLLILTLAASHIHAATIQETISSVSITATDHAVISGEQPDGDPTQPYSSYWMNEARIRAQLRQLSVSVQFANQLTADTTGNRYHPFVLEKSALRWESPLWEVVAGDNHQEFGKGIALALYADNTFGIDNTLQGLSVKYGSKDWSVSALGGKLHSLAAPVAINPEDNPLKDRDVYLAGGSFEGKLSSDMKAGGHYLLALNKPFTENGFDKQWQTVGATYSKNGLLDGWDVYAESNVLFSRSLGKSSESLPNGYGSYASIVWAPLPWQFKLEGKDYREYRFDFRRPPTLEEDVVQTLNTQDVSASRLTTEHHFVLGQSMIRGSFLYGYDRIKQSWIHHAVAGGKFPGPYHLKNEVNVGYRWLPGEAALTHAGIKTKIATFKSQSVELGFRKQVDRINLSFLPTTEDRNIFDATYNFSSAFSLSGGLELIPTNNATNQTFASVGAVAKLDAFVGKAFIGKTSGGTQCSGGVCRRVPPYSGAYVESTYTF